MSMNLLKISLFYFACLFATEPCAATIFAIDHRTSGGVDAARFYPVGLVLSGQRWASGFLVSPCHILSVRHVIDGEPTERILGVSVKFRVYHTSEMISSHGIVVQTGLVSPADPPGLLPRRDWIIVRLDKCLGRSVGFLKLSSRSILEDLFGLPERPILQSAGYPFDKLRGREPIVDPQCHILAYSEFTLHHDCATLPGNSGSPIVKIDKEGKAVVVAIITNGNNRIAGSYSFREANLAAPVSIIQAALQDVVMRDDLRDRLTR